MAFLSAPVDAFMYLHGFNIVLGMEAQHHQELAETADFTERVCSWLQTEYVWCDGSLITYDLAVRQILSHTQNALGHADESLVSKAEWLASVLDLQWMMTGDNQFKGTIAIMEALAHLGDNTRLLEVIDYGIEYIAEEGV